MSKPEDTLTPREFETVRMHAEGSSRREIAAALDVTPNAVSHMIGAAREKTGRETAVALALWFREKYPSEEIRELAYTRLCVQAYRLSHQGKRKATVCGLGR